jgi:hypothetical protein
MANNTKVAQVVISRILKKVFKHLNNLTILEYQKSINNNLKNAAYC